MFIYIYTHTCTTHIYSVSNYSSLHKRQLPRNSLLLCLPGRARSQAYKDFSACISPHPPFPLVLPFLLPPSPPSLSISPSLSLPLSVFLCPPFSASTPFQVPTLLPDSLPPINFFLYYTCHMVIIPQGNTL